MEAPTNLESEPVNETTEAFAGRLRAACARTECVAVFTQGKKLRSLHAHGGIVLADALEDMHKTDALTPLHLVRVPLYFTDKPHNEQVAHLKAKLAEQGIDGNGLDIEYA